MDRLWIAKEETILKTNRDIYKTGGNAASNDITSRKKGFEKTRTRSRLKPTQTKSNYWMKWQILIGLWWKNCGQRQEKMFTDPTQTWGTFLPGFFCGGKSPNDWWLSRDRDAYGDCEKAEADLKERDNKIFKKEGKKIQQLMNLRVTGKQL